MDNVSKTKKTKSKTINRKVRERLRKRGKGERKQDGESFVTSSVAVNQSH